MATPRYASLRPSDFTEGTGLVNDVDVVFAEVKWVMWDYQGKVPTPSPALFVKMVEDDKTAHDQYWSAGNAKDWIATPDGKRLSAASQSAGINNNTNAALLITSIINAGFPEDRLGDDITVFQGIRVHVTRVPAPKRGMVKAPREDGRVFDDTILIVDKIHNIPGEKAKGKKGGPATSPAGEDASTRATEVILGLLADNPGGISKQALVTKVFQAVKGDSDRNEIVQLVHTDEFLKGGPWAYEGGRVTQG